MLKEILYIQVSPFKRSCLMATDKQLKKRPFIKSPKKLQKLMKKEVHQGMIEARDKPTPSEILSPKAALKTSLSNLPKKVAKKERARLAATRKQMAIKKQRHNKKSRNTTPGESSTRDAPPDHIHAEGLRWIQNSKKKTQDNNKLFNRKSTKKT